MYIFIDYFNIKKIHLLKYKQKETDMLKLIYMIILSDK